MNSHLNIQRFIEAQNPVYELVIRELLAEKKTSHWMWFIFPQIVGLGHSPTAVYYAISSVIEAEAYLAHEILGERLHHCVKLVYQATTESVLEIFGPVDTLKLCSCLTLFDKVSTGQGIFKDTLDRYYDGEADSETLAILSNLNTD